MVGAALMFSGERFPFLEQGLLGGPWLGAEIVILTPSDSPLALRCQVISDPPVVKKT